MKETNSLDLLQNSAVLSQPPETQQRQDGDKNTQIGHADNVSINNFPKPERAAGSLVFQNSSWLWEHYNLFVVGEENFTRGRFSISSSRVLNKFIEPTVEHLFTPLDEERVEAIKKIPSLFACENERVGVAGANQLAYFGFVTDVRIKENLVQFYYQLISKVPQQTLMDNHAILKIDSGYPGIELNHTHWTIKHANLVGALRTAGVSAFQLG